MTWWTAILSAISISAPLVVAVAVLFSVLTLRSLVDQQRLLADQVMKLRTEILMLSKNRREGL